MVHDGVLRSLQATYILLSAFVVKRDGRHTFVLLRLVLSFVDLAVEVAQIESIPDVCVAFAPMCHLAFLFAVRRLNSFIESHLDFFVDEFAVVI